MEGEIILLKPEKELTEKVAKLDESIFHSSPWGLSSLSRAEASETEIYLAACLRADGNASAELLGYVLFSLLSDAEIYRIAVEPEHRRRGLGGLLIAGAEEVLREHRAERLFLEVREDNLPAVSLYRSRGFKEIGIRKAYYRDPCCDALVMEKIL